MTPFGADLRTTAFALPIVRAPLLSIQFEEMPLSWYYDRINPRVSRDQTESPWDIDHWITEASYYPRTKLLRHNVVGVDVGRDRIAYIPQNAIMNRIRKAIIRYTLPTMPSVYGAIPILAVCSSLPWPGV